MIHCPSCSHMNPVAQKFCGECGARLLAAVDLDPANAPAPSYTPPHLARDLLTSRFALEGERKLVTVMFCDIANSTPLAARVGAEAMHGLLNRFFELALAEVHRYEGTINQFLGDGFMALFGAPIAHEDHARRALLAASAIQQQMREADGEAGYSATFACAWGSTPAWLWSARSATTCAWTTPRSATRPISPRACRDLPSPAPSGQATRLDAPQAPTSSSRTSAGIR